MAINFSYHKIYKDRYPTWVQARDMYAGRHEVLTMPQYLWKTAVEALRPGVPEEQSIIATIRGTRVLRTRIDNLVRLVLSILVSFYMRKKYTLSAEMKKILELGDGEGNFDGQNNSLWTFIKWKILRNYFLYNRPIVFLDMFPADVLSQGQALDAGLRPYASIIHPLMFTDWQEITNDPKNQGRLQWFRKEYYYYPPRISPTQPVKKILYSMVGEKTQDGYSISYYQAREKDEKTEEEMTNCFRYENTDWELVGTPRIISGKSHIPISLINEVDEDEENETWLHDCIQETLRYNNKRSQNDNHEYVQGFDRIFVKGLTAESNTIKTLSNSTWIFLPENGDAFKIPPVDISGARASEAESKVAAIKAGLNMLRVLPDSSKEAQSTDAQRMEKENMFADIESSVEEVEGFMNDVLRNYAMLQGKTLKENPIALDRSFIKHAPSFYMQVMASAQTLLASNVPLNKGVQEEFIKSLNLPEEVEQESLAANNYAPRVQAVPPAQVERDEIDVVNGEPEDENPTQG